MAFVAKWASRLISGHLARISVLIEMLVNGLVTSPSVLFRLLAASYIFSLLL